MSSHDSVEYVGDTIIEHYRHDMYYADAISANGTPATPEAVTTPRSEIIVMSNLTERCHVNSQNNNIDSQTDDFVIFDGYIRKPTKRFNIRGFLPSKTENKIAAFVRGRGPKVNKVLIFHYEHKPTVVRLNIEDNDDAYLLNNPNFWPASIVCRL